MAQLLVKAVVDQLAKGTGTALAAVGDHTLRVALARDGCSSDHLSRLTAVTSQLIPHPRYGIVLERVTSLRGSFDSQFLADISSRPSNTTLDILSSTQDGRNLVLLVTALDGASVEVEVTGILQAMLCMIFGHRIPFIGSNLMLACCHPPTLGVIKPAIDDELDWLITVSENLGKRGGDTSQEEGVHRECRKAKQSEKAALIIAFGEVQQKNAGRKPLEASPRQLRRSDESYIRIQNLVGLETVCAALVVVFGAQIEIPPYQPRSCLSSDGHDYQKTRIVFAYNSTAEPAIKVCIVGQPLVTYIDPDRSSIAPPRETTSVGHVRSTARARLLCHLSETASSFSILAMAGAFVGHRFSKDMLEHIQVVASADSTVSTLSTILQPAFYSCLCLCAAHFQQRGAIQDQRNRRAMGAVILPNI
jgi:hypothetical protein